jgi:hypothetical protein
MKGLKTLLTALAGMAAVFVAFFSVGPRVD